MILLYRSIHFSKCLINGKIFQVGPSKEEPGHLISYLEWNHGRGGLQGCKPPQVSIQN